MFIEKSPNSFNVRNSNKYQLQLIFKINKLLTNSFVNTKPAIFGDGGVSRPFSNHNQHILNFKTAVCDINNLYLKSTITDGICNYCLHIIGTDDYYLYQ